MIRETRLSLTVGVVMILCQTLDWMTPQYVLAALLLVEGFTPLRPTSVLQSREGGCPQRWWWADMGDGEPLSWLRRLFSAERLWRLTVVVVMVLGWSFPHGPLWYVPWFLGLALIGAGVSGVCPMYASLKAAGLR